MIPSTDLTLIEFTERHDDDGFLGAEVTVAQTDATREFTARVVRGDDGPEFSRFDDSGDTGFVRTAFTALWFCVEEFHERDIHPDMGALTPPSTSQPSGDATTTYATGDLAGEFETVVEYEYDNNQRTETETETKTETGTESDTDSDSPSDAAEAPQPATAVTDDEAMAATRRAPDAVTPHDFGTSDDAGHNDIDADDLVAACPECDTTQIAERVTKPDAERWACYECDITFAEPNRRPKRTPGRNADSDDETDDLVCDTCGYEAASTGGLKTHQTKKGHQFAGPTPPWLARNPHDILDAADTTRDLPQVIEAASGAESVRKVTQALAMVDAGQCREQVLQPLGLLATNGKLVADDIRDERLTVLGEWVDE